MVLVRVAMVVIVVVEERRAPTVPTSVAFVASKEQQQWKSESILQTPLGSLELGTVLSSMLQFMLN